MRKTSRRFKLIAGTVAAVLVGGGFAIAYWTTTGGGTGSASTGTASAVTVTQDSTISGLVPGGAAQPIDFTVHNPSSSTSVSIKSVTVTVTGFANGCSMADFSLVQPVKPSTTTPVIIPASGNMTFTSGSGGTVANTTASLAMIDSASNQDGCKSNNLTLTYNVT